MPDRGAAVDKYLAGLPEDRRAMLQAVRRVILENLDAGYAEGIQYNMIGYFVPHEVYPPGYHCDPRQPLPFVSLASQKNHLALYLMCLYQDPKLMERFQSAWKKTGKKLDMGKSCLRFKSVDDLELPLIGEIIRAVPASKFVARYEEVLSTMKSKARPKKKTPAGKTTKTARTKKTSAKAKASRKR